MRAALIAGLVALLCACASGAHPSATLGAGSTFRDCAQCPEMVVVPAGRFVMGSPESEPNRDTDEGPQRRVAMARDFAVGKFEVTRAQYTAFAQATGRATGAGCFVGRDGMGPWLQDTAGTWMAPGFTQTDDDPVVCVSWDDARAYVEWLNTQTSGGYRLLSESEWEYAARAGHADDAYPWGPSASSDYANYGATAHGATNDSDRWINTSPVGSFRANQFGLYDMHGNVWEWVEDCYASYSRGSANDGSARERGVCQDRVFRGGAWDCDPKYLRSANRGAYGPAMRYANHGFRVAKTI